MPRGRKETSEETKRNCLLLYEELQSYSEVGRRLNLAPNTVKKIVNDKDNLQNNAKLLQEYAKIKEKDTENLLNLINDARYINIANNIVDMLSKKNLDEDRDRFGLRNPINLLGNIIDKGFKLKNLEIKQKQLELDIRQLELKERELDARLENPDAFASVQIINDAPSKENNYGTN